MNKELLDKLTALLTVTENWDLSYSGEYEYGYIKNKQGSIEFSFSNLGFGLKGFLKLKKPQYSLTRKEQKILWPYIKSVIHFYEEKIRKDEESKLIEILGQ